MNIPSQEQFLHRIWPYIEREGQIYRKKRLVDARPAIANEVIETITNDGLETSNTACEGDFVVRNHTDAREQYILTAEKFSKRYQHKADLTDGWSTYRPIGQIRAIEATSAWLAAHNLDVEMQFMASWGEPMMLKVGDFLATPPDGSEVYRIARKEFFDTYALVEEP
jgi:hypothetical protein